jgi:hypothetical protein
MKRIFRIDIGNYGGELTIGSVTSDFVEYWKSKIENGDFQTPGSSSKLISHLKGLEWGDEEDIDAESPKLRNQEDQPPWSDVDDVEHLWGPYGDSTFKVTEVTGMKDDEKYNRDNEQSFKPSGSIYVRETYFEEGLPEASEHLSQDEIDKYVIPVLLVHPAEKGSFGCVFVETENGEEFDPQKFSFGICENNYFEVIDRFYYNRKELDIDTDWSSTRINGEHAMVGYFNMKYHDSEDKYTEGYLKENNYWEE